jgi:hypothetical protein
LGSVVVFAALELPEEGEEITEPPWLIFAEFLRMIGIARIRKRWDQ